MSTRQSDSKIFCSASHSEAYYESIATVPCPQARGHAVPTKSQLRGPCVDNCKRARLGYHFEIPLKQHVAPFCIPEKCDCLFDPNLFGSLSH